MGTLEQKISYAQRMTQQNILAAAKQGNPQAIAALMNRSLAAKGVTAKAQLTERCLHVMLEAEVVPNQQALVAYVTKGIRGLESEAVQRLVIYGRQHGADFPAWTEPVELQQPPLKVQPTTSAETFREPAVEQVAATAATPLKATALPLTSESTARSKPVKQKLPWYETDSKSIIIALLVLFFPLGLWSMWKHGRWSLKTKGLITGAFVLFLLVSGQPKQTPSPVSSTPPVPASAPSPPQAKTVEISEMLETAVGPLPVVKYEGDSCLYANATTAQTNHYGMAALKDQLKARYNVTCVFWN